ncbi:MAG: S1C family serine protease [Phototrophicaceae bacterium]|jgi:S1-C subfamily serine protease
MSATLKNVSEEMAALVETLSPSLVRVDGRRRMAASGLVYSADGVIVTSNHAVTREDNIRVGLADGSEVAAALVGRDPMTDIAVLKAEATGLTVPTWVTSDHAKVGYLVLALGRPGHTVQATLGVISALGEGWQTPDGGQVERYFQTDVVMYPGFSGGALASADGNVFGMNTSALMRGVSLTIPTETIVRVVGALLQDGHIKRGYLGITAQTVRLNDNLAEKAGQDTALLIASVDGDGPAGQAGIYQGDMMIKLGESRVRTMEELVGLLSAGMVGKQLIASILRGGQVVEVPVTVGERN